VRFPQGYWGAISAIVAMQSEVRATVNASSDRQVEAGRNFQEAVREVLTANAELLILARKQESPHRR